ncbi:MAG TPA: hypothetical protein PKY59_18030 [Pyrinomonadaceae bacterium]|nr:hypothetical protein [Pyrinomonadaceae bacterium]
MKPLQHAQISAKTYGGVWTDYIELHNFLDLSKSSCAHFKHRFLLHHAEGIDLAVRLFGEELTNSDGQTNSIRQILTDHLIEDVGSIVSIEDWADGLLPKKDADFNQFLAKKRAQIENDTVKGERELLSYFNLSDEDSCAIKSFLASPLQNSTHPAAILFSHNSFAIFLAEKLLGVALTKNSKHADHAKGKKQLIATREVFERMIFQRMKVIYSPAEIIARTAETGWMRGKYSEKKRSA